MANKQSYLPWALGVLGIALAGGATGGLLVQIHHGEEALVWEAHRTKLTLGVLHDARTRLEFFFKNTYETARTISLIPGVREAKGPNRVDADEDVVAEKRLGTEADVVIRNLYLNLVSNFTISEIYCVLDGFTPTQVPFFMYDQSIVAPEAAPGAGGSADVPEADESEEYAYFPQALARLGQAHPTADFANLAAIPVVLSPPMVTCDNSQYLSVKDGDKAHTRGLVASIPLYGPDGRFKGLIAVIYRLDTLTALLMNLPFLPITPADQTRAKAAGFDWPPAPAPLILRLPGSGLNLGDPRDPSLVPGAEAAEKAGGDEVLTLTLEAPGVQGASLAYWIRPGEKAAVLGPGRQVLAAELLAVVVATLLLAAVWTLMRIHRRRQDALLERLTEAVGAVGQGELGTTLGTPGRVGGLAAQLGGAFEAMVASIRDMVEVLKTTLEASSRVSQDLASSSVEASATLDSIQDSLANIGSVVEALEGLVGQTMEANFQHAQAESLVRNQVDSLVSRLSNTANYVESSLTSFRAASDTMTRQSQRLVEFRAESREARSRIDHSSTQLGQVENEAVRIAEAVGLISDITAKTKLLAMNAAIEAAHAGSAGRGFGVVSQNIRSLAEETEARNSSITGILTSLQAALARARESQDWTKDHLGRLLGDFETLGQDLADVSTNMEELGQGSHEVLDELTKTRKDSLEVVAALNIMTVESEKLVTKIGELVDLAQTTTTETRAVEGALAGVSEVVELVSHAGTTNLQGVETLRRQIERFRE